MNFPPNYKKVIAIIEQSSGGETNGDMWLETQTFHRDTPINKIVSWAYHRKCTGRLIIAIDENIEIQMPEFKLPEQKNTEQSATDNQEKQPVVENNQPQDNIQQNNADVQPDSVPIPTLEEAIELTQRNTNKFPPQQ